MERITEQAQNVAHDVREQAEGFASEWRGRMTERSVGLRDIAVRRLRDLATELRQMAAVPGGSSTTGHELARLAADRLDLVCSGLESREPGDVLVEVRTYARNHPAQVAFGMLATGFITGRILRGGMNADRDSQTPAQPIDVREGRVYPGAPDVGYIA